MRITRNIGFRCAVALLPVVAFAGPAASADEGTDAAGKTRTREVDGAKRKDLVRRAVPSAEEQATALGTLKGVFGEQYKKTAQADRQALARAILESATSESPGAMQYAALREACDVAAAADDMETLAAAADALAAGYKGMNATELKVAAIEKARAGPTSADSARARVTTGLRLAERAALRGETKLVNRALRISTAAAKASKDKGLVTRARVGAEAVRRVLKEATAAREAEAKLQAAPDDAAAHLALGRFLCFVKDDWAAGLPHLAAGRDATIAAAARLDLANPDSAEAQAAAAEAWWAVAEPPGKASGGGATAAGRRPDPGKQGPMRRAAFWYARALPELRGIQKAAAETRIAQAESDPVTAARGVKLPPGLRWLPISETGVPPSAFAIEPVANGHDEKAYLTFIHGGRLDAEVGGHTPATVSHSADGALKGRGEHGDASYYFYYVRTDFEQTVGLRVRTSEFATVTVFSDGRTVANEVHNNRDPKDLRLKLELDPGAHLIVIRHVNTWADRTLNVMFDGNDLSIGVAAPAPAPEPESAVK